MTESILLGLLQNTAILLSFSMLYDNIWIKRESSRNPLVKIFIGAIIGGIGIILMLSPWTMIPGIVFDTRSVMLSVAGLFFGALPTFIAMLIDISYRVYIGGDGVWMGSTVIFFSGIVGILWHELRPNWMLNNKNIELLLMGIIVHFLMLACTFLLPDQLFQSTLKAIIIPVVLIYIPATILLGRLMIRQYESWQNKKIKEQLLESERKLNLELIAAKNKAEESDRLKSAFLANMSHEIRTPMNGILGFAEILQNHELTGDEIKEYLGIVKTSGTRMLGIIKDLIEISKVESGLMKVNLSLVDINKQLEILYHLFKPDAESKGLQLSYNMGLPDSETMIISDEEKINAIITNLLRNAIKFSTIGEINFGYCRKGNFLEFHVKDNGIGIPLNRQAAIFERFVQADYSLSNLHEGAGLGLSIAKAYVELIGGKIWLESEVGMGSKFYFSIPIAT